MEKNWNAALIFLCIFLAGGVAGAFIGMRIVCTKTTSKPASLVGGQQATVRRPIDDWSKRKQKEFATRLGLTPEQQTKTETLFLDALEELRQVRERSFQQTSEITSRLEAQTMDLLTAEQRPKFLQIVKEREERQKKAAAERAAVRNEHPSKPGEPQPPSAEKPQPAPASTVPVAEPQKTP
jgi:uncharacterized membrane protein